MWDVIRRWKRESHMTEKVLEVRRELVCENELHYEKEKVNIGER